jgi:hypothetical protein
MALTARSCRHRVFARTTTLGRLTVALLVLMPLSGAAWAQGGGAMKSSAPEMMTPPGESDAMRECDKLAMDQHIKMEDRTRFVKECIAKKMK